MVVEELVGQGAVEAFGFSVGLGPVGVAEDVADVVFGEVVGEFVGPEVRAVVGDDLVDAYTAVTESKACPLEKAHQSVGGFVVEGFCVGQSAVVVYGYV